MLQKEILEYEETITFLKEQIELRDKEIAKLEGINKIKQAQIDAQGKILLRQNIQLRHQNFTSASNLPVIVSQIDNATVDAIWEEHNKGELGEVPNIEFLEEFNKSMEIVDGNIAKD